MDLLPAVRGKGHYSDETVAEMGQYGGPNGYTNGAYEPTTSVDGRTEVMTTHQNF